MKPVAATDAPGLGSADETAASSWVSLVRRQVGSLRFGVVQIVVHDGRVVQVERTEKVRLEKPGTQSAEYEI